ncbi:raffinose/stachyose/melibiose transport system permease protein [Rhizobium sp. BK512]|jgi:raffinose/stachyose/melibiose transport system permease protein|uniref:carbohydrate ABC transporter permease n=1 Tax=Rhizobium sp. BK512 TaxID=2587010 RepID=UPI0018126575|nr:carbohydrate ABC transporter permease [Rhizobium sp. BK512]MBB3562764.1 raffinose/stachyose/melibiose transport system permease protein [Rhizobium sp. BK512]
MLSSSKVSSTFYGTSRHRMLLDRLIVHGLLIFFVLLALGPICVVILNSFKTTPAIFGGPFDLPTAATFGVDGYIRVFTRGNFLLNYRNSLIVTVSTIVLTVVLSALAAYGLTEYRLKITPVIAALFVVGIMLPIRLGTVPILKIMITWGLVDTLTALILVYTAMSIPIAVTLMMAYFRTVPTEIKEAARMDGAGEFRTFRIVLPVVKPGLAAVATLTMLPVWNDLWFPLILAPGKANQTVTLGVQQFVGQFLSDYPALLAALTLGVVPLVALYVIFSRQFIRGLSQGVGK